MFCATCCHVLLAHWNLIIYNTWFKGLTKSSVLKDEAQHSVAMIFYPFRLYCLKNKHDFFPPFSIIFKSLNSVVNEQWGTGSTASTNANWNYHKRKKNIQKCFYFATLGICLFKTSWKKKGKTVLWHDQSKCESLFGNRCIHRGNKEETVWHFINTQFISCSSPVMVWRSISAHSLDNSNNVYRLCNNMCCHADYVIFMKVFHSSVYCMSF